MRRPARPKIFENVRVITVFSVVATSSRPGFVVIAAHVLGIGGVEHQQHVRQAAWRAGARTSSMREVGAGRIVRVGEEHDPGLVRHAWRGSRRRRL